MPPPIQIKRPDVAEDIRTLAALAGLSITEAVGNAVRAQLAIEKVKASAKLSRRLLEAEKALADLRKLPVVGAELTDDDLYNHEGLPK